MTRRENILKAIRFDTPEYIPIVFHINAACWHAYDQEALKDLIEAHTFLFPNYQRPTGTIVPDYLLNARKDQPYTDPWRCTWETTDDGITGTVHRHPLESWDRFAAYTPPNPENTDGTYPIDWEQMKTNVRTIRNNGDVVVGGLPHGHTFLRLQDLRGYTNLIMDMADEHPNLLRLLDMVADFNYDVIRRWTKLDPDMMTYPEDLGMQVGPMISPKYFRKYIKPIYQRLMQPARERSIPVHMHSDGDIRTLVDDLIDGGVEILNLQDLVNGIDWIAAKLRGRVCIDLDIDRQHITAQGTPPQIEQLIHEEVEKLGDKRGGLLMIYGLYPGVPLANVKALMDALEKYATYYS